MAMLAEEGLEQRARHFPDGSYYSGTWLHDLVSAWERGAASSVHADASTPVPDASSGPPRASFLSVRPAHPSPASGSAGGPGQRYGRAGGLTAGATATSALFSTCVQPHGQGEYRWVDGSFYDGTWSNGLRHGVGKYVWPSGTVYQGEWRDGRMHGVGTIQATARSTGLIRAAGPSAGTRYQGGWSCGVKQGLGKQTFDSGDVYEGLWRDGKPEGPGRYLFRDGSQYNGQWLAGLMHGSGTFVWASGERYDGHWKAGQPDGIGVLTLPDGHTFDSQWQRGVRHGVCLQKIPSTIQQGSATSKSLRTSQESLSNGFRPSMSAFTEASLTPLTTPTAASPSFNVHKDTATTPTNNHTVGNSGLSSFGHAMGSLLTHSRSSNHAQHSVGTQGSLFRHSPSMSNQQAGHVSVREYQYGRLVNEWCLMKEEAALVSQVLQPRKLDSPFGRFLSFAARSQASESSSGRLMGQGLSEGHRLYEIVQNLQLGIRYSVMRVTSDAEMRDPTPLDFKLKVKQFFPRIGCDVTPVHSSEDFQWKDYAPQVFRKLRELFGVDGSAYMNSLCSDAAVRLLNSPGKSGSVFFLSHDDRFFVKTIKAHEAKLLFQMLPHYYRHLRVHPHTLLTKFYGLHCIKKGTQKMYVCVMANVFTPNLQIHTKYDLKGSRVGRTAGQNGPGAANPEDPHTILKDLDLDVSFRLDPDWLERLEFQLRADCALLRSCQIMDYSCILGVTYKSRFEDKSAHLRPNNFSDALPESQHRSEYTQMADKLSRSKLPEQAKRCLLQLASARQAGAPGSQAMARRSQSLDYPGSPTSPLQAVLSDDNGADQLALLLGSTRTHLGVHMPAVAIPNNNSSNKKSEEVVLSFGIIDFLQGYNPSKRLEHGLKSLVHDSYEISVTDPTTYAQRFQSFLRSVFC